MHTILRELIISVVQHNISLFASHVPGEQNDWADAISRLKPDYMCQLTPDKQSFQNNPNNVDFWLSRGKFHWFRKQHSTKQYQVEKDIFFYFKIISVSFSCLKSKILFLISHITIFRLKYLYLKLCHII